MELLGVVPDAPDGFVQFLDAFLQGGLAFPAPVHEGCAAAFLVCLQPAAETLLVAQPDTFRERQPESPQ